AVVFDPLHADRVQLLDTATLVADELLGVDEILTRVGAELGGGFLLSVVELVDLGPLGLRIVRRPIERRLRQNLELDKTTAAVPHGGPNTVRSGVAAADDDDVFVLGGNISAVGVIGIEQALGVLVQKFHREVNALQVAP